MSLADPRGWGEFAMRVSAFFALAFGAAFMVVAPANAAHSAEDEPVLVQYGVTFDDAVFGPGEEPGVYQSPTRTLVLECASSDCRIVDGWPWLDFDEESAAFPTPGTLTASSEASGSVCDGTAKGSTTISLAFSADGVTGSKREEPMQEECDSGTATHFGHVLTITSSKLLAGECFFAPGGCAAAGAAGGEGSGTGTTEPAPGTGGAAGSGVAASSSQLATADPSAPSVLSALASPTQAGTAPSQLALAALLTIVLVLLVALPTSLLNSAAEEGSDRISAWRSARRRPTSGGGESSTTGSAVDSPADADTPPEAAAEHRRATAWWWAAMGVVSAGVISAFVDPQLGLNLQSARVLLSILSSFAVDVVLGWSVVIWLVRRTAPGATHSFVFRPATLLVVAAAVTFTRLTGFEPGIVFGLVAGVAFGALAGRAQQAKAVLVTLGYAFFVALAAWVLYGALGGGAATGDSFWSTFLIETLSAIAVGGMAALPVALFPVRGMAGFAIWSWHRWVWAACYAVGLFAFFVVLMPMPFAWDAVAWDLAAWIGVYLAYAIGAVVAWLVIARPWRHDDEPDTTVPDVPAEDAQPETPEAVR